MVWLRVTLSELREKRITTTQTTHESLNLAEKNIESTWDVSFSSFQATKINENGSTILKNTSTHDIDAYFHTGSIKTLDNLCRESFQNLHEAFLDTFWKKQEKTSFAELFWRAIINSEDPIKDKGDTLNMKARLTTTETFLTEGLE